MTREKTKTIDLRPFPYSLKLIVTDDIPATERAVRLKLGDVCSKVVSNDRTGAISMYERSSSNMYIIMPYKCDVGYIAHEVWHIVRALLTFVSAGLDNETVAYYIGWLTREAVRFNFTTSKTNKEADVVLDNDELRVVE